MSSLKSKKKKKIHSKKEKQLIKLINNSDSESECSEHELSYYLSDRVKLMKEVLKIIKPKKIKSMAPDCIKNVDNEEINSMLLEELLGISNKRLKYIFNGQNLEEDSSSTEEEQLQQSIDIISLDDISDDDFIDLDSDATSQKKGKKKHKTKVKEEPKKKKMKKEKQDKSAKEKTSKKSKESDKDKTGQENLMSVLELLELQARARAIRSQLALENSKKAQEAEKNSVKVEDSDHDDAVIIESPKNIEIVITSSESETEDSRNNDCHHTVVENVAEEASKEDNIENSKESEEKSNQPVIESNGKDEGTILNTDIESEENQVEESEDGLNNKEKDKVVSEDMIIESSGQPNLITEQNKSKNVTENRETRTEGEEVGNSEKQQEKVFMKEKGKKSLIIKSNNSNEEASTSGSISQDIFIIDSGSENERTNKSTRRKCKKSKKSRREGCKHKTVNTNRQLDKEIKSETTVDSQTKMKSVDMPVYGKSNNPDEGEGIVINMDPSEIDCIISD